MISPETRQREADSIKEGQLLRTLGYAAKDAVAQYNRHSALEREYKDWQERWQERLSESGRAYGKAEDARTEALKTLERFYADRIAEQNGE